MSFSSVLLLGSGCIGQNAVPQDYFYRLPTIHPKSPLHSTLINGAVAVDQFDADGVYRERPLLYVDAQRPLEVMQYHYRHWIQTPSQLVQESVVDYLREANIADSVERFSRGGRKDLLIKGRLQKFERLVQADRYFAVVEMEMQFRKKTPQGTIEHIEKYKSQVSAHGPTIHDSVAAFGEALQEIYDKMLNDLNYMSQ